MVHRFPPYRIGVILMVVAISLSAFGDGRGRGFGSSIEFTAPGVPYESATLTISFPNGETLSREYSTGRPISLRVSDLGTDVPDGQYNFELVVTPKLSSDVRKKLENARAANDEAAARKIIREAGLTSSGYSGTFSILRGSIVDTEATEGGSSSAGEAAAMRSQESTDVVAAPKGGKIAVNDQVIPDDLIVQGSTCVGLDCVNNENFGFDTLRLKENNTRIHFDDTSTTSGFAANDWTLIANDSASGGASKFSVEDRTGAKTPFTITAGASTNSIFVDSTGRVGFRTSTPVLDLHVATGNTPALRLEQSSSGGFTAQTWDIAGNEANFFVRDVTGGSKLPFRIRPGAPTSSVDISASGDVGIGTGSPSEKLHVFENADTPTFLTVENPNAGTNAVAVLRADSDTATVNFQAHSSTRTISRFGQALGGWNEMLGVSGNGLIIGTNTSTPLILGTNATARMTIASTGAITVPGNFTVTGTKNFAVVDPADSKTALYYTALEGPEAGTYFRGSAKTVNGEVVIELPGYFARLTESERMTVQITPVGAPGQLYVASKSPEKIVIKAASGSPDLEFDYFVQGVRKGYLDYEVERAGAFPVQQ